MTVDAQSRLPKSDYVKNKFFDVADMRRVYRFDATTQRLDGFEAYLRLLGGDVLILKVEKIEYNEPIDQQVFALKLPKKPWLSKTRSDFRTTKNTKK